MEQMPIGALSEATGVKVPTIRFYEEIGLLPAPIRTQSNRRSYGDAHLQRLRFIRHARDLGFAVDDIRELLAMAAEPQASCDRADSIAQRHLADVERRIAQLQSLRGELQRMVGECQHGRVAECRVIESLADHGHCLHDHRVA
ncbi:DNA-binding transcriptional regulator, MerR family [Bosea sp. OK403]|jgi:DNA-binding transcriptional MerR regulator|uniref:MerR family transcriptional regulator n=1 Tax=unclassified Bosea (in: a-proteobacteria) TaxID=2653178 RepID=UPI0008ED8A2B|nr:MULTISPECIES: helix-turn-helix domain-containing protein [unclassified Bosea (in: a-proteobacteria)]MDR6871882.1 DNA-binding transcriptional MerR regulator [Bosea sp. BE125]WNJ93662.1 helix-turn-helix domain-containing protein [Bosea sp. 685]SFI02690.1 DNA-binding transcriptional regulator, MerR family [Bosea sp. OK403]